MTSRERAEKAYRQVMEYPRVASRAVAAIEIAIDDTVAEEREECKKAVSDTEIVRMGRGYLECDDARGTLDAAERAISARGSR